MTRGWRFLRRPAAAVLRWTQEDGRNACRCGESGAAVNLIARQTRPFALRWTPAQVANIGHTGQKADLESNACLDANYLTGFALDGAHEGLELPAYWFEAIL
jgi:hypothetical protein